MQETVLTRLDAAQLGRSDGVSCPAHGISAATESRLIPPYIHTLHTTTWSSAVSSELPHGEGVSAVGRDEFEESKVGVGLLEASPDHVRRL